MAFDGSRNHVSKIPETSVLLQIEAWLARKGTKTKEGLDVFVLALHDVKKFGECV